MPQDLFLSICRTDLASTENLRHVNPSYSLHFHPTTKSANLNDLDLIHSPKCIPSNYTKVSKYRSIERASRCPQFTNSEEPPKQEQVRSSASAKQSPCCCQALVPCFSGTKGWSLDLGGCIIAFLGANTHFSWEHPEVLDSRLHLLFPERCSRLFMASHVFILAAF